MRCRHSSPARQRGAALVVAMLVFALCAALIVAMKSEFTRFYQRGANMFLSEQAQAYLRGAEDLARAIYDDMKGELPERLASIREEMANISSQDFWEMSDRGVNFDYLEPERRARLAEFFRWFMQ